MAGALLSIIIPVVLFIFLQRFFVRGIVTSGLKQ
jgi:ABC-type glycerol-3-phosphate transport system permease component